MRDGLLMILIMALVVFVTAPAVVADVPTLIGYQGVLLDSYGYPVITPVNVTFTLYDTPSNGSVIWQETQLVEFDEDGCFNVILGETTPVTDDVFDDPVRWLGVQVEGDAELEPRSRIVSVAYAHRISTVDGAGGGTISGDVAIQSDLDVDGDIRATGKATIGPGHTNTGNYAFVVGENNTAGANYSSVGGGMLNVASGDVTTVGGGLQNTAGGGGGATVAGGGYNEASSPYSAVGGGAFNNATGEYSTVGGGDTNTASADYAAVGGGFRNTANFGYATVAGGANNAATGEWSTVAGGVEDTASGSRSMVGGGVGNTAGGQYSIVGGGYHNNAIATASVVAGGQADTASGSHSVVGGGQNNTAGGNHATVGGGRSNVTSAQYNTIGGGYNNSVQSDYGTVCGGQNNTVINEGNSAICGGKNNTIQRRYSFIGGGSDNYTQWEWSVIGGGWGNATNGARCTIGGGESNVASATHATVGGGWNNTASGQRSTVGGGHNNVASAYCAVIPGGCSSLASGDYSFAAGSGAKAIHNGTFVWADAAIDELESTADNQIMMLGSGGTWIYSDPDLLSGVTIHPGASAWATYSDGSLKENLTPVDSKEILQKISSLPVNEWNFKAQSDNIKHIGPTAQDFYTTFDLGDDDKTISTIDPSGVALAGIQALLEKIEQLEARIAELEAERK